MARFRRTTLIASLVFVASVSRAHAIDVTACGQFVPPREVGTLVGDLDCSAVAGPAVSLGKKAKLDLAGHTITGNAASAGVSCTDHCSIVGGGTISGAEDCVRAVPPAGKTLQLVIEGLTVSGCGNGIAGQSGRPGTKLRAKDLVTTGNTGWGILVASVSGANVTASSNGGPGIVAGSGSVNGQSFTVTGNDLGIGGHSVVLRSSVVTGNGDSGVRAVLGRVTLRGSTVTGHAEVDVGSHRAPRLVDSTCDRSAQIELGMPAGPPWGVCSLD